MKVHPVPKNRNITIQYDMSLGNPLLEAQVLLGLTNKLRRLPHVFSRVLELPFRSDADVFVEENAYCFRFVAETEPIGEVRTDTIEIQPGVTKIVVRNGGPVELSLDDIELDMWRFRLPELARPELASAICIEGELVVTVPKGQRLENSQNGRDGEIRDDGNGSFDGGMGGRLVVLQ